MNLSDLNERSPRYKARKRVGRGQASGSGKTSGRGQKGAGSRSGHRHRHGFEGGQMSLIRRLPKRGFNNVFRTEYDIVNLETLNQLDASDTVTLDLLEKRGILKPRHGRLKILAKGKLEQKLVIEAAKFSAEARRQIEELGGQAKVI